MTVDQFREKYPDKAYLQGDALWNAMEDALLAQMGMNGTCVHYGEPDNTVLSEEDEKVYQEYRAANEKEEYRIKYYTRKWWLD